MAQTQNGVLKRDDNDSPVMGGTSTVDNATIINSAFDPITRRLLTSGSSGGTGTVTSVSVVTANGFAGTVATATTTPAITLTTTITGVLKGNGTAISAGVAGDVDSILPTQTGNSGKVLSTNGTNSSWIAAGGTGTVTSVASADGSITVTNPNTTVDLAVVKAPIWTTARLLAGNSVNGSANVAFANKFIVQGTTDTGLSGAQFLGALGTGIVKNTTTTGVLSIAIAADFPTLNQSTTGSAATLTTPRTIGIATGDATSAGSTFDGSANNTNALTLATVNGNVGSFTNANITVNAKGLVTAAANGTAGLTTLTVGTTTITSGTTTRMLYDNAGVLGETTGITTNGTVATLTTPVLNGTPTGTGVATAATASTLALRDANGILTNNNELLGYTTTVTAAGITTLTNASNYFQFFTGTSTQTVKLPGASSVLGQAYYITNLSTAAVTIQSSGANTIYILAGGTVAIVVNVSAGGTTAASWSCNSFAVAAASGKIGIFSNSLTLAGTDATTMTFPTTSATIARTDAAQTFTGVQTLSSSPVLSTNAVTGSGANTVSFFTSTDTVVGRATTDTLTNKNITRRLVTVNAPGATPTTTVANVDIANFTGVAAAITSMSTNLANTGAVDGQLIEFRFTDNGTARAITWGASFGSTTVTLPTTTVISTMLRVLVEYNGSIWQCVAVA